MVAPVEPNFFSDTRPITLQVTEICISILKTDNHFFLIQFNLFIYFLLNAVVWLIDVKSFLLHLEHSEGKNQSRDIIKEAGYQEDALFSPDGYEATSISHEGDVLTRYDVDDITDGDFDVEGYLREDDDDVNFDEYGITVDGEIMDNFGFASDAYKTSDNNAGRSNDIVCNGYNVTSEQTGFITDEYGIGRHGRTLSDEYYYNLDNYELTLRRVRRITWQGRVFGQKTTRKPSVPSSSTTPEDTTMEDTTMETVPIETNIDWLNISLEWYANNSINPVPHGVSLR